MSQDVEAYQLQSHPSAPDAPPSFVESQFDIILRRQRARPLHGGGLKHSTTSPSRFVHLSNDFEFAGWGSVSCLELTPAELAKGSAIVDTEKHKRALGVWTASAVAANDVLGSVFYALPAVVAISGVYSPISLFIATLAPFLWRPIMEELGAALPVSGAPYSYLLNASSKPLALSCAVLMLLDTASTAIISAATAASYIQSELPSAVQARFPEYAGALGIFALFAILSLAGMKESARVAACVLVFHMLTMTVLVIASLTTWIHRWPAQLVTNWTNSTLSGSSPGPQTIAHQIFNGVCIGMLGLTGIECGPTYITRLKPIPASLTAPSSSTTSVSETHSTSLDRKAPRSRYSLVLRTLHIPALVLTAPIMLLVLALLPLSSALNSGQGSLLCVLAEQAAGKWLRTWVLVDAIIVLCAGVLTGILTACALLERLAEDRILHRAFLYTLPHTGSRYVTVIFFVVVSAVVYVSSGANLNVISDMFSLAWLAVMFMFPLSVLLLKFNRGRLPRMPRTSLTLVISTLTVNACVFGGVVAVNPSTGGYFSAYFVALTIVLTAIQRRGRLMHLVYWAYDQSRYLQRFTLTRRWADRLATSMRRIKRQPVCVLAKTDEINDLFKMILYVRQNEDTSCIKLAHFYQDCVDIPSELEPNAKILDEAFPDITIDLVLVKSSFTPTTAAALATRLDIPRSLMFMSCPGVNLEYEFADFGARIISM